MKKNTKKTRRVVVAFRLAGEPGRRKLGGFLRRIAERGLDWNLQFVRIREDFSAAFVASFAERGVDGVVFSMPTAKDGAAALAKIDIPTVTLDLYDADALPGRTRNLVSILGSPDDVGKSVAHYLLSQGLYRAYGYVPDLAGHAWGRLRGDAFVAEMARNGLPVVRYRARGKGYDLPQLTAWLARLPKPAAVFAAFDDRAARVLEACREAGLDVPHDVAVVGVDNDETLCAHVSPTLTSVQPDHARMGALAADKLAQLMDAKAPSRKPEVIRVGVKEIVVRESTNPVSGAGRLVQRALAFIRAHAAEPVKPRDVAAFLKVSRSLADLRFRELQGESIGTCIRRVRLEEVRRRLLATNDAVSNVASACGFAKVSRLNADFKKAYGCALRDCRRDRRGALSPAPELKRRLTCPPGKGSGATAAATTSPDASQGDAPLSCAGPAHHTARGHA